MPRLAALGFSFGDYRIEQREVSFTAA